MLFSLAAQTAIEAEQIYSGSSGAAVTLLSVTQQIPAGAIVIVSENHDNSSHHLHQKLFLQSLSEQNPAVAISVGMEFFEYPQQALVDRFLQGQSSEEDFLKAINWGGNPYDFYRDLVAFPLAHQGWTYGLNASRELTRKISKNGLESLSEEDRLQLPENFALGNDKYFARFRETMAGHVPEAAIQRYFAAQSVWDDTMASQAIRIQNLHPEQILVIIVGDFHAQYGGGLPDRIRARGHDVQVISQVNLSDISEQEKSSSVLPHPEWGVRADWVWTSDISPQ